MSAEANPRIESLDQFRGYAVLGMIVVNFVDGLSAIHPTFSHHNNYFSLADSIMPSFLLASGISYRLTFLRRLRTGRTVAATLAVLRRSLALICLSLFLYGFGGGFANWSAATSGYGMWLVRMCKADLWEVLAIIGAAQLLVLPFIATGWQVRLPIALALVVMHVVISFSFNFDFVWGLPNWLDELWGTTGQRARDGGLFGLLNWSAMMLAGTLVYDLFCGDSNADNSANSGDAARHLPSSETSGEASRSETRSNASGAASGRSSRLGFHLSRRATSRLVVCGILLMFAGYATSCLSRLFDSVDVSVGRIATSGVFPDLSRVGVNNWRDLVAEPPFVPPPVTRPISYWTISKRMVSAPFVGFATGFAMLTYAAFVLVCDVGGWKLAVLRSFGTNALAAYAIHHVLLSSLRSLVPADSPLWFCLLGLLTFLLSTYWCVRYLERNGYYLRI